MIFSMSYRGLVLSKATITTSVVLSFNNNLSVIAYAVLFRMTDSIE